VGGFADVSEIYAASIFRVEVCKMRGFLCVLVYMIPFRKTSKGEWGLDPLLGGQGTVELESFAAGTSPTLHT
jgi:hypothetical protein